MKINFHDRQDLLWLNKAIPKARGYVVLLTLVQAILGLTGVGYAACLRKIVDSAVYSQRKELYYGIGFFAGLIVFRFIFQMIYRFLDEFSRATIENQLKLHLTHSIFNRDYAQVTNIHSGEWMNRMTSDTVVVTNAVMHIIPGAVGLFARLISAAAMLLVLIPRFTILLLIGGSLISLSTLWMRKRMKKMHKEIQECDGRLRVFLTERLGSLMILKAYHQEDFAEKNAEGLMDRHKKARMKKNQFSNICNSGFSLAMNSATVLGAAYCGIGIINGTIGYGTFTAVIQLVGQLQSPIAGITGFVPQYYAMLASVERLREVENFSQDTEACNKTASDYDFDSIGLRKVSYTYPGEDSERRGAVSNMSMDIKKGEYVAFSGPSGCGKSTVLKLLLCLYAPDSGERYVMRNGKEIPLTKEWSRLFAYVPQGNHLMSGKIRDVVTFACPGKSHMDQEIFKALDIACAKEFVQKLPEGLDTMLGERGAGLSEGQMQRLAVARALFSERPVLLLDEATSALDGPSEVKLLNNIRSLTGKTVIIITHRPAALEMVDKVIEFSEGEIYNVRSECLQC